MIPVPLIGGPADGTTYAIDPHRVGITVAAANSSTWEDLLNVTTITYVVRELDVLGRRLIVATPSDWPSDRRNAAVWAWLTDGRHNTLLADQATARTRAEKD